VFFHFLNDSDAIDRLDYFVAARYCASMPTILRRGPYRVFFYSGDRQEPPHVHIERDDKVAKFWLERVRLQDNGGFPVTEINRIRKLIEDDSEFLLRSWNEYFNS
jgi:hypothetical protein